jgi:hypothetical protein
VVAVEYFSKWIEAKPLATITSVTVQKFFWQNIVYRFGMPKAITVDNGTQFEAETFKDFYDQIGTKIYFASVRHLESNGLVERVNDTCLEAPSRIFASSNFFQLRLQASYQNSSFLARSFQTLGEVHYLI